jgi:hypothetical protein
MLIFNILDAKMPTFTYIHMAEKMIHYTPDFKENAVLLSYDKKTSLTLPGNWISLQNYFLNGVQSIGLLRTEVFPAKAEIGFTMKTREFSN